MKKEQVSVVYDRRNSVKKNGVGNVDIRIYLSRKQVKFITIMKKCSPKEWKAFEKSKELSGYISLYSSILKLMEKKGEEMNIEVFDSHIGTKKKVKGVTKPKFNNLIDFINDHMKVEGLRASTMRRRKVVIDSITSFARFNKFSELTQTRLIEYDEWLRDGSRTDVTIANYHKTLKLYCRLAKEKELIEKNPYDTWTFKRGKSKERQPLTEEELLAIRNLKDIDEHTRRVRDMFIFAAYTGLAYADLEAFEFSTMSEKHGSTYYIDGSRVKTGSNYFTPILPPAMEILERNNYELPHMSNQKVNDGLKVLKGLAKITKPVSFHVARHSFATLTLSHNVPIEKLARMMGHQDIKTTQIYAKILKSTIQKEGDALAASIL